MLVFFFFKQKTAYEMRISDWSSDVCSSDLPGGVEPDAAGPPPVAIPSARALLLLGDGPSKALLGKAAGQARGTVHQVELGGRPLSAVATFAPHFLIRQPRMKALAWADLRLFATLKIGRAHV